jgi:hypothetical protein
MIDAIFKKTYVLLSWEDSQVYIKQKWFHKEAIRHNDSFFIPIKYIYTVQKGFKIEPNG